MLEDALTVVSWRSKPRSFVSLMGLYESNFIRLGWLIEDLPALEGSHRSRVAEDCELLLTVEERAAYTVMLNLTYLWPAASPEDQAFALPDMRLRVYHDARLAEAHSWATSHGHQTLRHLRDRAERELDQRWARNVMLNKWLEYCVERGHRFSPATRID